MIIPGSCLLAALSVNSIAYHYLLQNNVEDIPLNDIVHNNLPHLTNYYLNDICVTLLLLYTLFVLDKKHLRKYIIILSLLYSIRAISFSVTQLPSPNIGCKKRTIHNTCNDLMFSGHTTLLTTSLLALYFWKNIKILPLMLYYLVTIAFVILPRKHYTVDIFIASVLSSSIFYNLKDMKI